jgi:phenylacetate-CoA ligase
MGARALWAMGCRPSDFVVNCFNYSIYAGGVTDHMAFETLGATVLPYGVGNSRRLLEMKADMNVQKSLYSTPSYAIRLASVAEEMGVDLRSLNVKKGFFSGEAGLQVPGYRERIENLWGMKAHDLYGMAELGVQSAECEHNTGLHYSGAGHVIAELIDPDTGEVKQMEHGVIGELVFTTINRQASPLVRMRTHDYVQVYTDPCPCGRTGFRFHTRGRSDDMVVIKGVNIFPMGIQKALSEMQPQLTGEFQMILDKAPPIDYLPRLKVEVGSEYPKDQLDNLEAAVIQQIQKQLGFSAQIEFVPSGEIASEHKTKRVIRNY